MKRAQSLAPEERRKALKEAVLPLVLEHGAQVSTRQIAEAAGVAEGTIFRAFPTKQELINEVIFDAVSPEAMIEGIDELPADQSLVARVQSLLTLMTQRIRAINRIVPLLDLPHMMTGGPKCPSRAMRDGRHLLTAAVAKSLAPYTGSAARGEDRLRVSPLSAAAAVLAYAFAAVNIASVGAVAPEPDETTSLLLYGIAAKERS